MNLFCFKKKDYECPYCFFYFETKEELKKHKKDCLFSEKNTKIKIKIRTIPPSHK